MRDNYKMTEAALKGMRLYLKRFISGARRHDFIGGGSFGAMTDSQPTDAKGNALLEVLFRCRSHACFRYPLDGPNEIEKAIDDAIEEVFGKPADSAYSEWLCKLRRNGLIP